MTLQPPWSVFVIDKGISNDFINDALTRAYTENFEAGWYLWIATDSYADLPPLQNAGTPPPSATIPPLPTSLTSDWIGKTVEDCAAWLAGMPPGSSYGDAVNRSHFIVMNDSTSHDDTILTCRWKCGDDGAVMVEYFPQETKYMAMEMWTNGGIKWDEKATNYQRSRMSDGKPDKSRTFEQYT